MTLRARAWILGVAVLAVGLVTSTPAAAQFRAKSFKAPTPPKPSGNSQSIKNSASKITSGFNLNGNNTRPGVANPSNASAAWGATLGNTAPSSGVSRPTQGTPRVAPQRPAFTNTTNNGPSAQDWQNLANGLQAWGAQQQQNNARLTQPNGRVNPPGGQVPRSGSRPGYVNPNGWNDDTVQIYQNNNVNRTYVNTNAGNGGYYPQPVPVAPVAPAAPIAAAYAATNNPILIEGPDQTALRFTLSTTNGSWERHVEADGIYKCSDDREWYIEFDRGGGQELARYRLRPGVYKFIPSENGWDLKKKTDL